MDIKERARKALADPQFVRGTSFGYDGMRITEIGVPPQLIIDLLAALEEKEQNNEFLKANTAAFQKETVRLKHDTEVIVARVTARRCADIAEGIYLGTHNFNAPLNVLIAAAIRKEYGLTE